MYSKITKFVCSLSHTGESLLIRSTLLQPTENNLGWGWGTPEGTREQAKAGRYTYKEKRTWLILHILEIFA